MKFDDILDQVITLLKRQGRVSYRALKMRFEDIDDEYLDVLKEEILFVYPVTDEDSRGLVWTGETLSPEPDAQREVDKESRFHELTLTVIGMLQRERRVTYRRLKYVFSLHGALIEEIREELRLRQLAVDEEGKVLVWIGETQSMTPSVVDVSSQTTTVPTPLPVTKTATASNGPTVPPDALATDVPRDEAITPSEPTRMSPEAERRQLTVMFCDLSESTKLSHDLDPEDLREVIRAYQQTSAEVTQRFDGYTAQHLGDGLLIYFGWPRAHEDDAQRALHAGLGIVEAITTSLNPRLKQKYGVALTVRLGVHTGPVVVGEMGGGDRLESLATGETVNIAARLEGLAQPNTVVVSSVTERLVRGAFVLDDLGTHALKGVAEPMQVFRVLSPTEVHRDEDERMPDGGVFLVGRDEEVGLLLRRWEQSKDGLGQVVLISGEAGIGKSTLTATMRTRVAQAGATRITFRCSPYHTNSALYPVIAHLEQMLGFDRDDSPEARLDKLEQVLRTTSLPLEESVPLVATLLSVPVEDRYPAPALSPQQQRQQTLDTLVAWLMEESEKQPVLAVWEDLHWADPSTLEMLGIVLEQSPTVSMLNVLTFRPEFEPLWPTRSHMTPLTLNRLERPQVEALITHLAGDKILPAEVVAHIVTKTDGVPLYVEELTKMLLASDLLQEETDQYVLTGPLSTVAIPDTLQDSLMARLDQMNTAKEVAQLGSVMGREFDYEVIQAISSQDEETLQASLAQLVSAELLYQRGRPPRARYIFKHALIQDAAYASLLRSQRQQYHQRIVQVLEEQFPETAEIQPELLAHHYAEARLPDQAIGYWHRAGQRANERSANVEAVRYLKNGLAILKTLPESAACLQYELDLQTTLAQTLKDAKGYGDAEVASIYKRVQKLCQQLPEASQRFRTLLGQSIYHVVRAELQTAYALGEQLLSIAQRDQDAVRLVEAYYALGVTSFWLGRFVPARAELEQGIIHYDPHKHRFHIALFGQDGGAVCLCRLAIALWYLGYPEQALCRSHEALTLVQALAHPFSIAYVQLWVALLYHHRRETQNMQEMTDTALAWSTEQGFPYWTSQGTALQGWLRAQQGQVTAGIAQIQQGLVDLQVIGTELMRPYYLSLLADAYGQSGQIMEGLHVLAEALTLVEQHGERWDKAELHRLKGALLLQQSPDNHTEAETCFQQAIAIAQNQQGRSLELRAATSLAKLWQSQGKRDEAYDLLEPVYSWFTEGFDTADLIDAKALLDELSEEPPREV
jgi:predicted ATPase/class 3 adenylate cyclase